MRIPFTLVLASQSPRRSSLLTQALLPFTIKVSSFDEASIRPQKQSLGAVAYVSLSAHSKASDVCSDTGVDGPWVVLGCDTVVASPSGAILEKPTSEEEAKGHLRMLSGSTHKVYTGVSLITSWGEEKTWVQSTDVTFRELGEGEIGDYVASGEPMDKAGSYGIQGAGGVFVQEVSDTAKRPGADDDAALFRRRPTRWRRRSRRTSCRRPCSSLRWIRGSLHPTPRS